MPLGSVMNVKGFKQKREQVETNVRQDLKTLREKKVLQNKDILKLKARYSQFNAMSDFSEERVNGIGPLELISFMDKADAQGPLAGNELELMLKHEREKQ